MADEKIPQALIDEARTRRPLSVVIGAAISLRKVGREFEGICPFHNDHTPSLNVNDAKALWLCRTCGAAGDAITFLMQYHHRSFGDAVRELAEAPHETSAARFMRQFRRDAGEYAAATANGERWEPNADQRTNMIEAGKLWKRGTDATNTPGHIYLRSRGIRRPPPKCLRFLPSEPFWMVPEGKDRPEIAGYHPVLLAAVETDRGMPAVQRIYLQDDGRGKAPYRKPKKALGPMHDGAVRLSPAGRILGLAEGVETAMSAAQIFAIPTWAVLGNKRFTLVKIPAEVEQLILFADNVLGADGVWRVDPVALEAADEYDRRGIAVVIEAPEGVKDWNDALCSKGSAAA